MKRFTAIVLMLMLILGVCTSCGEDTSENTETQVTEEKELLKETKKIKFELEDGKSFVMEIYPEYAPETATNFYNLVKEGFYDGIIFHRVIPGFMAQAGDPSGTGMGGSKETIPGEFSANGYTQNTLKHERGVVSMARTNDPNSASSQFFICFEAAPHLDGQYAAFGKVIEGMETVDSIAEIPTDAYDKPTSDVVIKTATVLE